MRIGIQPDGLLERAVLASGVLPTQLVLVFWGMGVSRTAIAACRLGVFEGLEEGPATAADLAARLGLHAEGTRTLLASLNGFGFVRQRDGVYRNARLTRRWLLLDSPRSVRDLLDFMGDLWDRLEGLEGLVRTGEIARLHDTERDEGFWRRYVRALGSPAKLMGPQVIRRVKLARPPRRLLDVGGGHGMFSVAFCRNWDGLTAEVLDLAPACVFGHEMVVEEGFADRVVHRPGDFRECDWGTGWDVVLLFNVIHNATGAEAERMFRSAWEALAPGGTLVVLDGEHRPRRSDTSTMAGWNELFFFLLSASETWPEDVIRRWVEQAGFVGLRRRRIMTMPEFVLTAIRPEVEG